MSTTPSPTYCATEMSTAPCLQWAETGLASQEEGVVSTLRTWCSKPANIASSICRKFCSSKEGGVWCDDIAKTYCGEHADETTGYCACYNLNAETKKLAGMIAASEGGVWDPTCYLNSCRNDKTAYVSPAWDYPNKPCPIASVCDEEKGLIASEYTNIDFSCAKKPPVAPIAPPITTPASSSSSSPSSSSYILPLWAKILFICVIVLIFGVGLMNYFRYNNS